MSLREDVIREMASITVGEFVSEVLRRHPKIASAVHAAGQEYWSAVLGEMREQVNVILLGKFGPSD